MPHLLSVPSRLLRHEPVQRPFEDVVELPAIKLMDFGIAVHNNMKHRTLACGTRMYSSPEQTQRDSQVGRGSSSCYILFRSRSHG